MIAACATHIPLREIPAHVIVIRDGQRLQGLPRSAPRAAPSGVQEPAALFLQRADRIQVSPPAVFSFSIAGNAYRVRHGILTLVCRGVAIGPTAASPRTGVLAVDIRQGRVSVQAGSRPRRALLLTPELLAFATIPNTRLAVDRNPATGTSTAVTLDRPIIAASAGDEGQRIATQASYTAISNARGLRLDVWPFSISGSQRAPTPADRLPPFWADGRACSVGCAAPGATPGWPIQPFHRQHAIRSGINELRPANFHVAVDIEATDFQPVFAVQSGYASTRPTGSYGDYKVTVGSFTYWHIVPTVSGGQYVVAYKTEIGAVERGFGHLAFEEGGDNDYLNPLRPGGSLQPYQDTAPPIIGRPRVFSDGHVIVGAFDPQTFIEKQGYETPVLAPAALAWRLYTSSGRPLTGLQWALRGSGYISPNLRSRIFAPGAANPGFACFERRLRCIPNWVYQLAGGVTGPLPVAELPRGQYRLTVYAWDWAGNRSALDDWITLPLGSAARAVAASRGEVGRLAPRPDP